MRTSIEQRRARWPTVADQHPSGLFERVTAVMDELLALQREVEALPHFVGKWHAENGLRQARTYASDCRYRLLQNASSEPS